MRHLSIAAEIRRALGADDYEHAETLLADYSGAFAECGAGDVAQAISFVHEVAVHLRARRAHMLAQLKDLHLARPYQTPDCAPARLVDCVG